MRDPSGRRGHPSAAGAYSAVSAVVYTPWEQGRGDFRGLAAAVVDTVRLHGRVYTRPPRRCRRPGRIGVVPGPTRTRVNQIALEKPPLPPNVFIGTRATASRGRDRGPLPVSPRAIARLAGLQTAVVETPASIGACSRVVRSGIGWAHDQ